MLCTLYISTCIYLPYLAQIVTSVSKLPTVPQRDVRTLSTMRKLYSTGVILSNCGWLSGISSRELALTMCS